MTKEEQLFAYKELRNNGQAFFVDTYEDADRIIDALEDKGYQQGRADAIDEAIKIINSPRLIDLSFYPSVSLCAVEDRERDIIQQLEKIKEQNE